MKKLITIFFVLLSFSALAQNSINAPLVLAAQSSVDGKQYKLVANKHVPYASSADFLSNISPTRRHIGQIGYIANGNKIDVWQFINGIADSNFRQVSIDLPPNNIAQDSILITDTNGIVKNKFSNPWNRTGNSGTNYLTDYIGTNDNVSLRFRVNNIPRLVIDSVLGGWTIYNGLLSGGSSNTIPHALSLQGLASGGGKYTYFNVDANSQRTELKFSPNNSGWNGYSGYVSAYSDTGHGSTYSDLTLKYYGGVKVDVTAGGQTAVPKNGYSFQVNLGGSPQFTIKENNNVHIGPDTSAKQNSVLTITPATPKGILLPRLSRTQRNTLDSSTTALLFFNTTTNYFEYSAGGHWKTLTDSSYRATPGGGGGGGSLSDNNYGDITVSLGGTAMNVNDSVIHANNVHDVAASTITGTRTHSFISDFATSNAGSADILSASRNVFGYPFNGSADLTGIISATYLPSAIPYYNQANNFATGSKQTFQSSATTAGLRLSPLVGDPTSVVSGDAWYNSNDNSIRYRANANNRIIVNTDETQVITNKDFSNSSNTPPLIPIAKGGSGQTTANASLNAFLPTQTSNTGKVLQSDGTNTSWKVKVDSSRALNDSTVREYYSDGTHHDIVFDTPLQTDSSEHTIGPTISFTTTGGTNPSGTTNNTYQWSQSGKMITVRFNVSWGTVGTGSVSAISFNMPSDLPTPKRPTGFTTATDYLYIGDGYLSTTKNSVGADRGRSFINWDGTNYNIVVKIQTAAAIQYGYATLQYFVP